MKAVVVYYSLEGNSELIANMISKKTGADVIRLKLKKEISKNAFLKYFRSMKSVMLKEKPKLQNKEFKLDKYNTVFIGTPTWGGAFAPALSTFINESKIQNKNIIIFACHGGGGAIKVFENLKIALTGNTVTNTIDFIRPLKDKLPEVKKKVHLFCEDVMKNL